MRRGLVAGEGILLERERERVGRECESGAATLFCGFLIRLMSCRMCGSVQGLGQVWGGGRGGEGRKCEAEERAFVVKVVVRREAGAGGRCRWWWWCRSTGQVEGS